MVLAAIALLILAGSFVAGRLDLPPSRKRRMLLVGGVTIAAALVLSLFRLTPVALLALLIGAGFSANIVMRELSGRGDFAEPAGDAPPPRRSGGPMGRAEALEVLGLEGSPDAATVNAAHRRMIVRAHPDQGGSDYLAAKVNEARQVLLPKN